MIRAVLALVCAVLVPLEAPALAAESAFEQQVLIALNAARTDPAAMADLLRDYRGRFRGTIVTYPGGFTRVATREGVAPVDEAIRFLAHQPGLAPVMESDSLSDGAQEHVADQGARGLVGHDGSDGSSAFERIQRHGGQSAVAEVIQYGAEDPLDVIRQLIVDDGVAGRGHRRILFDPALRFAGVACGRHRDYGMMCVIDFARGAASRRFTRG